MILPPDVTFVWTERHGYNKWVKLSDGGMICLGNIQAVIFDNEARAWKLLFDAGHVVTLSDNGLASRILECIVKEPPDPVYEQLKKAEADRDLLWETLRKYKYHIPGEAHQKAGRVLVETRQEPA